MFTPTVTTLINKCAVIGQNYMNIDEILSTIKTKKKVSKCDGCQYLYT